MNIRNFLNEASWNFWGTFDPIHNGHLITAQAVKEIRDLEKIIFIPANISPHKIEIVSLSSEHRLKMVQLAIESIPYFDYSDIELKGIQSLIQLKLCEI